MLKLSRLVCSLALLVASLVVEAITLPSASAGPVDRSQLNSPYDGHPFAALVGADVEARYLPAELSSDDAILNAYAEGRLREARYPSIQLSGNDAYVSFELFTRADLAFAQMTMPRCDVGNGFRLLLRHAAQGLR
ncbi:hypothetical protein [Stenotrophomonas maltophilia]|uniref:hypothetical protein n=1 Tax=Stenotrophomonas maltophilia TaxID=40324 RepID=UPI0016051F9B|nr:hypothetical protein [Stenotrophomonas maltophilia]USA16244.1 hypothetical protein NDK23_19785 [Stenotrophomonas maltophilia]